MGTSLSPPCPLRHRPHSRRSMSLPKMSSLPPLQRRALPALLSIFHLLPAPRSARWMLQCRYDPATPQGAWCYLWQVWAARPRKQMALGSSCVMSAKATTLCVPARLAPSAPAINQFPGKHYSIIPLLMAAFGALFRRTRNPILSTVALSPVVASLVWS
jgi:hypothetical protein